MKYNRKAVHDIVWHQTLNRDTYSVFCNNCKMTQHISLTCVVENVPYILKAEFKHVHGETCVQEGNNA